MNIKAGDCMDCGRYWTVSGGGLNDDGQCPECAKRWSDYCVSNGHPAMKPLPHDITDELADAGAGLGI